MPSLYTPKITIDSSTCCLENEEFHHLSHVKRIGIGQTVKLNNGRGIIAEGIIKVMDKRSAEIEITHITFSEEPARPFSIAFALLKNRHDELLIEKCTELGASAFYPLVTDYSVKNPAPNTLNRFEKIALAAIKQCDNPWLPTINPVQTLSQSIKHILSSGYSPVLCSELRPELGISSLDKQINPCFIIGPEGGFNPGEFDLLALSKVPSISICPLITRAETAAIAVAAQFVAK